MKGSMTKPRPILDRFWEKTAPADNGKGCIIWTASTTGTMGYGSFKDEQWKSVAAHRWIYQNTLGVKLDRHQFVLHSCDVPICVNIDHLRVGTQKQNMDDMSERGRRSRKGAVGERNSHAKLTESDVLAIRAAYAGGTLVRDLAVQFGVSKLSIYNAIKGIGWNHLSSEGVTVFPVAKRMTKEMVLEMRIRRLNEGATYTDLAKEYGVVQSTVFNAVNGITWKSLPSLTELARNEASA